MIDKTKLIFITLVFLLTTLIYLPILNGFFQHDEWSAFARFFVSDQSWSSILRRAFTATGHFVPLYGLTYNSLMKFFGLNYVYYAAISLFLHLAIVYLVYLVSEKIFKNDTLLVVVTTTLFAVNAAGHQASTWPLVDINTHGAVIFGLLSAIMLLESRVFWSLFFLIVSLLFKEITVGFFLFLPALIFVYSKKSLRRKIDSSLIFIVAGLSYLLFRVVGYFLANSGRYAVAITSSGTYGILKNLLGFPFKAIYETIFPPRFLLLVSHRLSALLPESLTGPTGTTAFDLFTEGVTLPLIGMSIIFLFIYLFLKTKKKNLASKAFLIGLLFVIVNSFVYALSPNRPEPIPVIDSRNLYLPAVGSSLMLASLFSLISKEKKKVVFSLAALFISLNIFWLHKEINQLVSEAMIRKEVLTQIKKENPKLPPRVIFYTESDRSYYGLAEGEKILPFQTNLGLNLFVWYAATEDFSHGFIEGNKFFLYDLVEEGYKEAGGRGFGYFRNYEVLNQVVKENKLPAESIIAYRYDSTSGELLNITSKVRDKMDYHFPKKL